MEADWEFELGEGAPVIEAQWQGFSDLRHRPEDVLRLREATRFPPLREALLQLNASASPVWTSKCDFFSALEPGDFDADELDAPREQAAHAVGCYIDLLPRSEAQWTVPEMAAAWTKGSCERLKAIPLRNCRVDLVIRRAVLPPDENSLGITAYFTACGGATADAERTLAAALAAFADTVAPARERAHLN